MAIGRRIEKIDLDGDTDFDQVKALVADTNMDGRIRAAMAGQMKLKG